ncbi:MAG: diguanylate cyclase [Lentisphaerota bacterium]
MKRIKVIAVDDEIIILSIVKMLLEQDDFDVTTCTSGKECLELLEKNEYDLALLDIIMPEMNGHELCKKILQKYKDLMVIFLTGATGDDILQKSYAVGGFDYISKPVHKFEVISRINNAMRVKRAELQLKSTLEILEEKNEILKKQVILDGLTQLYNHKYIVEQFSKRFDEAIRYGQQLSIIMFDIDHFKDVNDTHGHLFGDTVLLKLSDCFKSNLRKVDFVGRYGGEEFLLILPNTPLENGAYVADFLRKKINEISFTEKPGFRFTISGGVSGIEGKKDFIEMLTSSDKLLYKAKENGRNRIEF